MAVSLNLRDMNKHTASGPKLPNTYKLNFLGDWGMANFHRICSWLTQQFCDRAGPGTQVAIWNVCGGGGIEATSRVFNGDVHLSIATPAECLKNALTGEGIFKPLGPMPSLRALARLPQDDRMVFAISPKYNIRSWAELRERKPPITIAASTNDGTNFIGYVGAEVMKAHGIDEETLRSWGGGYVTATRPEQVMALVVAGKADALVQEAIMAPWWTTIVEEEGFIPLPAEEDAVARFHQNNPGMARLDPAPLPTGYWPSLKEPLPAIDFADFVILVREDLPEEVAHLLTWCLVETRLGIESQYHHLPQAKSPLSYPMDPKRMLQTPLPLHPGAKRYYQEAGLLTG